MRSEELLIILLIGGVLFIAPLAALIASLVALSRSRRVNELSFRITELERRLQSRSEASPVRVVAEQSTVASGEIPAPEKVVEPAVTTQPVETIASQERTTDARIAEPSRAAAVEAEIVSAEVISDESIAWETFIGQKAFGWIAVVLFIFASSFFLRYAYQNNWIGPVGRVAIGELVGVLLLVSSWRHFQRGWARFANMLAAAGIVVLYLSTFSAFGFYRLLPQQHAGAFLAILIIESMVLAVVYRSLTVALVAVIGGLLTPLLLQSDHDSYTALFMYLTMLNIGVVLALMLRAWPAVGSVALLGTQGIFWLWYGENYHPEKFAWALGFQVVLFLVYLAHTLVRSFRYSQRASQEDLVRMVVNAVLFFFALRTLIREDYRMWLGSAALAMATLHALVARAALSRNRNDNPLLLTALAIAVGFIAWAFPIQADARWVALGWAAMGLSLWWFGLRISAPMLRAMAATTATLAVFRVLTFDLPLVVTREPFIPIFNRIALPAIGVAALVLIAVPLADRFLKGMDQLERILIGVAGVTGVLLLWLILSLETFGYFDSLAIIRPETDITVWHWRGQLAVTVLWTLYATVLLVLGFTWNRARLRWLAMCFFGISVVKLFVVDMANVQQLYRILAFFVLAVVLGLVARAYQRFK